MRYLATGFADPGRAQRRPGLGRRSASPTVFLLTRTTFGRAIYGIGNRERAAYLSGINTRRVVLIAFAISGGLSAFGGVLLAGYASKAAQSMGDAYLLPVDRRRRARRHLRSSAAAAPISAPSPASS